MNTLMSRPLCALLLFTASAWVHAQGENVDYGAAAPGYLALPAHNAKQAPALILIHEWWGLNDNIRDFAESFAKEGYVALAVDLYDGKVATQRDEARQYAGAVRNNVDAAFDNLRAAVDYLSSRPDVDTTRIAAVGWCFGGGWAYHMAKNDLGVKASVMYYGQFDPEADFKHMRTTILGHFGAEDRAIKVDNVKTFQANLKTANGNHEIYIYENAGHAFANKDNQRAYNSEAAALSWQRTMTFLTKHL